MTRVSDVAVVILAGGASRRFGSHKAFADLGGKPLLEHVLDRIRIQTGGPLLINTNAAELYGAFGLPVVPDRAWAGAGPLAGIHTAQTWAKAARRDQVVTIAVDQPFVPTSYISTLLKVGAPAIASSLGRLHPINAVWLVAQLPALGCYLEMGKRDVIGWAQNCEAGVAEFATGPDAVDPFLNVNTTCDLDVASKALADL